MRSAYDIKTGEWNIKWPGIIARHDLVYLSPPDEPMSGIMLGNGETGVLCWMQDTKIIMVINRSDLWDDSKTGRFNSWSNKNEEHGTTLRHGGRLIIDFNLPLFDIIYLSDFECRLSLHDASLQLRLNGPFGMIQLRSFVSDEDGILCCDIDHDLKEATMIEITLERYGSRMFHHWYSRVNPDVSLGLPGTHSIADDLGAYLTHELTSGKFAIGYSILDPQSKSVEYFRKNDHCCSCFLKSSENRKIGIILGTTGPMNDKEPVQKLKEHLHCAKKKGIGSIFSLHEKAWKKFWSRSFIESGDGFIDNIWYLTIYYASCSQRGRYPGRFIGSLWNWYHDFQAWGYYYHWNQQQLYWPLNAAGHHELVRSYLDMRFDGLGHAKDDAREIFGKEGAAVSDVTDRRGYNSQMESDNHTPGVQIALDFWRQYRYTQDEEFLKERALPYMVEIAKFFGSRFKKGNDGLYHAFEGTGYEGGILMDDAVSELASARSLFSALIEISGISDQDKEHLMKWRDIKNSLPEYTVFEAGDGLVIKKDAGYELGRGIFKGDRVRSNKIMAAGFSKSENRYITSQVPRNTINRNPDQNIFMRYNYCIHKFFKKIITDQKGYDTTFAPSNLAAFEYSEPEMTGYPGVFPYVEFAAVFPSGTIGLSEKDSEIFNAMVNTAKLYADITIGWNPLPIVLARLGLADELADILERTPDNSPLYANGTFSDCMDEAQAGPSAPLELRTQQVWSSEADSKTGRHHKRYLFPMENFRHTGFEAQSVISCALNEMLLQSHDGIIRIIPAVKSDRSGRFMLHATGGFIISSEFNKGRPVWVSVKSLSGKECCLESPWDKAYIYRNGELYLESISKILCFPTKCKDFFAVVPDKSVYNDWEVEPQIYEKNMREKRSSSGKSILGIPRLFVSEGYEEKD